MNRLNIKIILIVLLIGVNCILIAQTNSEDDCKANVLIKTNDSLSMVYINGNASGDGNSLSVSLPKGNYLIDVKNNKLKWDSGILHDTLIINNCDTLISLSYIFENERNIFINSTPSNAEIYYRDSLLGYTPLNLASDLSQIDVKKKLYETKTIYLDESSKEIELNLKYMGQTNQTSFSRTSLFKVLLGSAVALGATAAYFKLKADDNFERYNLTNDKKYLDKTDQYDLVSGIAFGALQVNFGVLIYYFLND